MKKKNIKLDNYENTDKKAELFILHLRNAVNNFLRTGNLPQENSLLSELKSFAIIDKFTSLKIADVYIAIKGALLKLDFVMQKYGKTYGAELLKNELLECYSIIEDLYFYEIFGFFSTTVHPHYFPEYKLPCKVLFACSPRVFEKEPSIDKFGNARNKKVARFENRKFPDKTSEWLCITISKYPEILKHEKSKCVLTDEQICSIKKFIILNLKLIKEHARGKWDSSEFREKVRRF